jgi:hypothetical protein
VPWERTVSAHKNFTLTGHAGNRSPPGLYDRYLLRPLWPGATVTFVLSQRLVKKQSLPWTQRGAHVLLQTRVKTLNNELAAPFRRCYPDVQGEAPALLAA